MKRKRAFTLVELLVVIVIIAILASMLLPAVSHAKASARLAKCKSNERQIMVAVHTYHSDYGAFPLSAYQPTPLSKRVCFWFDEVAPYLANTKWSNGVFRCPAYRGDFAEGKGVDDGFNTMGFSFPLGSYAYNGFGALQPQAYHRGLGGYMFGDPSNFSGSRPIKDSDVRAPSEMFAVGDAGLVTAIQFDSQSKERLGGNVVYFELQFVTNSYLQHAPLLNIACVDGHVESLKSARLFDRSSPLYHRWNRDNQN
jgi:prepilin-type N-terminal cleavage/methylation domain-containing protein